MSIRALVRKGRVEAGRIHWGPTFVARLTLKKEFSGKTREVSVEGIEFPSFRPMLDCVTPTMLCNDELALEIMHLSEEKEEVTA
jgi:hypothetical protein